MKKIIFSFLLLFAVAVFIPKTGMSQVKVKVNNNKTTNKVVVKKPNRNRGVTVKTNAVHHPNRVVVSKPNRPRVIVKKPNRIRRNHIWIEGHWQWSDFYGEYIWIKGKWVRKKRGFFWVPGFWEVSPGGFIWIEGYWAQ